MFDLEQAISNWRTHMLVAGIKTPVPLDELESHLREEIETQMKSETNEQRAFEVAVLQIGKAKLLKNEFKKAKTTKEDLDWKLGQIMIAVSATLIPMPLMSEALSTTKLEYTSGQQISILAAAATVSLLAWSGRLGYGIFPVIRAERIRVAIACLCLVLFLLWLEVFLHILLPRYDFTRTQLSVAAAWGIFIPTGTFAGLLWGIKTAARKKVGLTGS